MILEMDNNDSDIESSRRSQGLCFGFAVVVHVLAFLWNPAIMHSGLTAPPVAVTVDVVDQSSPGGDEAPAPAKMTLMDTLKDMLLKPKADDIAHVAAEPAAQKVAAPIQNALQDRSMPKSFATVFTPKSNTDDLATANPRNIDMATRNMAAMPETSPTLNSKAFSGIKASQLPFQVGTDQAISGGDAGGTAIPIAVGHNTSKDALNYGGATLQDSGRHPMGIRPAGMGSASADVAALGAGAPQTIALSGTGGSGNAPTGSASGAVLTNRSGSGAGGGLGNASLFNRGGHGVTSGNGIEGIPSSAQDLDQQVVDATKNAAANRQTKSAFQLEGTVANRPISKKVIPQYPAWAEEQGIIGSVRLYFTVTADGAVRSNIRVVKTTGYPQLDQLGIDALKQWQFAPLPNGDSGTGEWGIITFNFSLSS